MEGFCWDLAAGNARCGPGQRTTCIWSAGSFCQTQNTPSGLTLKVDDLAAAPTPLPDGPNTPSQIGDKLEDIWADLPGSDCGITKSCPAVIRLYAVLY